VARVASSFPPAEILLIDDILSLLEYSTPEMRHTILGRVAMLPPDQLGSEHQQRIVRRWAPLLIELGEWQRAFEVLETMPDVTPDSPLGRMKFEAALLTGRYDVSYTMTNTPEPWIAVLSEIAPQHQEAALRLRDEIKTRFNGRLIGEVKTAFDSASGLIPPLESAPITDGQPEGVVGQNK
ncbi:MAG: hypothetical protein O7G85_17055, partial [Planctomycetota bacterium]|nr:hypothetical protein [Planctomycetota bacterium]